MAVPALRALRRLFSTAHITIVARPWVGGLYSNEDLADEIFFTQGPSPRTFVREARILRRRRWDLAVLLQNAFGAALFARVAGAPRVAGYPTDGRRWLLDPSVPLRPNHREQHQVRYYMDIASFLDERLGGGDGLHTVDPQPVLRASAEEQLQARELLSAHGAFGPTPLVALNPGATNSRAKQWMPERFAEVADRLSEKIGSKTIVIGAASDRAVADLVASKMRSKPIVLAGQTSISELKGLLSNAALVISNDTGSAHVAAALGIPSVVIFGPTEHHATRPLSDVAQVLRHPVECSPCMLRDCPIDHRCMTGVETHEVYIAACRLIAGARRQSEMDLQHIKRT
jgi:heptosyltransferase-2